MVQKIISKTQDFDIEEIDIPSLHITDEDIIAKIKSEGFIAYGIFVKRYNQYMYRIARSIITDDDIAMDIVQEAHIKAFMKLNTFRGESTFATWIATITRNEALMHIRRYKKEVTMGTDEHTIVESFGSDNSDEVKLDQPDNFFENEQMQGLISLTIDKLSEKFRTVFILRAVEQFSTKETAKILNLNEITVKTRYFRAKRFLRNEIKNHLDASNLNIYEFGNKKCETVLQNVLNAIAKSSVTIK